jgi:hypothetical protein
VCVCVCVISSYIWIYDERESHNNLYLCLDDRYDVSFKKEDEHLPTYLPTYTFTLIFYDTYSAVHTYILSYHTHIVSRSADAVTHGQKRDFVKTLRRRRRRLYIDYVTPFVTNTQKEREREKKQCLKYGRR